MIALDALATALWLAAAVCGALVTTGGRAQRALGVALAFGALAAPAVAASTLVRGVLGLLQTMVCLRVIDLYREPRAFSFTRRLGHVFSLVDSRLLTPAPRSFDKGALLGFLAWSALGVAGFALAWWTGDRAGRWAGGIVLAYALVEALWACVRCGYAAIGFSTPVLHALPLASRSVQELWGERWATPIRRWLDMTLFRPMARRGWPRIGILLAFFGSALLHAYVVFICVGWQMAGLMLAYFLVQAGVVVAERALRVSTWRASFAHAWVIGVMVWTAPLFTEPLLRCVAQAAGPA